MNLKRVYCADIETDGFDATKIWCMSVTELVNNVRTRIFSVTCYDRMRELLAEEDVTWVIHFGTGFDRPTLEKLLDVKMQGDLIDTLALSWYLEPKRVKHGLESYGEDAGIPKPKVTDWDNLPLEVYIDRCDEDVKIQTYVWLRFLKHLNLLYKDQTQLTDCITYLTAKLELQAIQAKSKWKLDVKSANLLLEDILPKIQEAGIELEKGMPMIQKFKDKVRPKKPFKINGELSSTGLAWKTLVEEEGKDFDFTGIIKVHSSYTPPNHKSHVQVKAWLLALGWKPTTFKYVRDKEDYKKMRKIPQIKNSEGDDLCKSVLKLISKTPALLHLKDLGIYLHRKSIIQGMLNSVDERGFVIASCQGFTNTLRLKHKTLVNIPSGRKKLGLEIRGLLTARNDSFELLGSDMSSLEDRTKQHFMWVHDPEYVKSMQTKGFDPHIDIAVFAGLMSEREGDLFKELKAKYDADKSLKHSTEFERLSLIRYAGKTANYAATYGAGGTTIARAGGLTEEVGEKLHAGYWARNWSLKAIADGCLVKKSRGEKWLWNPVANMWYWLKADKDRFSTLNQGTGAFLFDQWVFEIMKYRPQLNAQFHDEIIIELKKGKREPATKLLKNAIAAVNTKHKLNRDLDVDIDFGRTYADIH